MLAWPLVKCPRADRSLVEKPSEPFPLLTKVLDGVDTVEDISPNELSAVKVWDIAMSLALSRLSIHSSANARSPAELDDDLVSSKVKC
jgi:hypothetical protein